MYPIFIALQIVFTVTACRCAAALTSLFSCWFALKLANTGNVLLSGDLYHYPEEITFKKVPLRDLDREQTAKSREKIEDFVKANHAQLWILHQRD